MEFELSKSQKEIEKAAREFAKGEFNKEEIIELSRDRKYPVRILKKAADLGFIGIHYPQSCEGAGMGMLEHALVAEQFCRQDSTMGMALLFSGFAAECIFRFGEKTIADRLLPGVVEGETLSSCAFFETGMFGNLKAAKTTVQGQDDHFLVNGEKNFILNGLDAAFYVVLCKVADHKTGSSDPELVLAVVESDRKGISRSDAGQTIGNGMVSFGHVNFTNVEVPPENLLGKNGAGAGRAPLSFLSEARVQISAMALGMAQGAFDRAVDYIRQREQFGRKLSQFQVIRHKIAEMAASIEQTRWLVYKTAWKLDKNKCDAGDAAIVKLIAGRCAMGVSDEAIQLLGGYGYMTEYEVEHFYRDAKTIEIFMGSELTLKDAIADAVIGKTRA
jgi:alkylation response protein AidB-like acyl-CoA dehydrogenase